MVKRNDDLEMYAVLDPRITVLNDLEAGQWPIPTAPKALEPTSQTMRRKAQWGTWQRDRSWPDGATAVSPVLPLASNDPAGETLAWKLFGAGFLGLGIVAAAMIAVGIESGLL